MYGEHGLRPSSELFTPSADPVLWFPGSPGSPGQLPNVSANTVEFIPHLWGREGGYSEETVQVTDAVQPPSMGFLENCDIGKVCVPALSSFSVHRQHTPLCLFLAAPRISFQPFYLSIPSAYNLLHRNKTR